AANGMFLLPSITAIAGAVRIKIGVQRADYDDKEALPAVLTRKNAPHLFGHRAGREIKNDFLKDTDRTG
ncbi:hypothetical protein, partial [Megasphaera vaginalis (ex Srinivasan et al. 2021)]